MTLNTNLVESIRSQLTAAMKERNEIKKGILRVILGDLSTLESRSGKPPTDEEVKKVIKKLIEGNTETMSHLEKAATFAIPPISDTWQKLKEENVILNSFLPKNLPKEEIKDFLNLSSSPIVFEIQGAKSDGQATGLAMKFFKDFDVNIDGKDVSAIVKELRS